MSKYKYAIVSRVETNKGIFWRATVAKNAKDVNLIRLLDKLGSVGWEVVSAGDLGQDPRVEILLKKTLK